MANELRPDLICLTGDFVDYPHCVDWTRRKASGDSPGGTASTLCSATTTAASISTGAPPDAIWGGLIDSGGAMAADRNRRGAAVFLGGNERPWIEPARMAFSNRPPVDGLRIVLAHSPDQLDWARRHNADLLLFGDTHGGQIRIPPLGAIFSPTLRGVRYISGVYHVSPTILHVSRGISGDMPVRWNCPPEIAHLTLSTGRSRRAQA